jgi:flagellar hook-associated protein 2
VIDGSATASIDLSDLQGASNSIAFSTLNDGQGVAAGDFTIKDSQGRTIAIDLNGADAGVTTVGALIDLINSKATAAQNGFGVTARINDTGTGIYLEDTAGGSGKLTVTDLNSTTAADLKIAGEGLTVGNKQVINGLGLFASASSAASGLTALAAKINELKSGVTASTVYDGLGYRLSLTVDNAGSANQLLVDAGATGFQFEETSKAQDALLLYGNLSNPGAGVLLSSPDGKFAGAIGGADVTVKAASDTPVTVSIQQTNSAVVDTIKDIVDSYNSLRSDLGKLTAFDSEASTTGLLFGTNEALAVDSRLSQALTSRYFGLGNLQSLEQVGLSVDKDGTLSFDDAKLNAAFAKDPDGVEKFFNDAQNGVAVKIADVVDRLAGKDGLLSNRSDSMKDTIKANQDRLDKYDDSLSRQQDRLFAQFYQLETVIANLQNNLSTIQNLQVLPALK